MSNHVVSIRINAKGYEDFLDSRFRYANRLYNKMVQYINDQEHNRVNSDEYKRLKDETIALKDLENQINLTSDKNQKKQCRCAPLLRLRWAPITAFMDPLMK